MIFAKFLPPDVFFFSCRRPTANPLTDRALPPPTALACDGRSRAGRCSSPLANTRCPPQNTSASARPAMRCRLERMNTGSRALLLVSSLRLLLSADSLTAIRHVYVLLFAAHLPEGDCATSPAPARVPLYCRNIGPDRHLAPQPLPNQALAGWL